MHLDNEYVDFYIDINTLINKHNNECFEGFGTSLSWFAHAIGINGDDNVKDYLCNLLFNQHSQDSLQLNIVRYNIGGVLDKTKAKFRMGADIPGYDVNNKENWIKTDLGQRYFLKKAKELGVDIFEAFSNSPPENMTINGLVEGNHYRCRNNIKKTKINDFTKYLVDVTQHLKQYDNISFKSISPMNEPSGPGWIVGCGQEGCYYDLFGIRKKVLKSLHKKVHEKLCLNDNYQLQVSACEENNMFQALLGILMNPYMWKYVDQYNIHRYTTDKVLKFDTFNLEDSNIFRRIIYILIKKIYKKKIWMSEWGLGNFENSNDTKKVFRFANSLMDDFNYLKPSAWIYWQVIENLSTNGWGCIQIPFDNPKIENIVYNVQFITFQHFTHYIKKGSYILKLHKPKNKKIKWIGSIKDNRISLIILSCDIKNTNIQFSKNIYNISLMCSYSNNSSDNDNNTIITERKMMKCIVDTKYLSIKPMSLTSISFDN